MACNYGCNCCSNLVKSTAVTYNSTANTLSITIPAATYNNHDKVCLVITQAIPSGVGADTEVNIIIGTDTTVTYPIFTKYLNFVYGDTITTRKIYPLLVATDSEAFVIEDVKRLYTTEHSFGTMPAAVTATTTAVTTDF